MAREVKIESFFYFRNHSTNQSFRAESQTGSHVMS